MERELHLVGSLPPEVTADGQAAALRWVREQAGDHRLTALPCDPDARWIIDYLDALAGRDELRSLRTGDSAGYDSTPLYRPARGGRVTAGTFVSQHRIDYARRLIEVYRIDPARDDAVPLQLSLPNPLDLALFAFVGRPQWRHPLRLLGGGVLLLRYLPAMRAATKREVSEVEQARDEAEVVWQLETPAVLYALNLLPRPLRAPAARVLARQVADALALIPPERAMLHLCYGDLADREIIAPRNTGPMVLFLNALGDQLTRRAAALPPVHLPMAYGPHPPPTAPGYYRPLADLRRPWPVIAGSADEHDQVASEASLRELERALGRRAQAVATACGLGRHAAMDAEQALAVMRALAAQ